MIWRVHRNHVTKTKVRVPAASNGPTWPVTGMEGLTGSPTNSWRAGGAPHGALHITTCNMYIHAIYLHEVEFRVIAADGDHFICRIITLMVHGWYENWNIRLPSTNQKTAFTLTALMNETGVTQCTPSLFFASTDLFLTTIIYLCFCIATLNCQQYNVISYISHCYCLNVLR